MNEELKGVNEVDIDKNGLVEVKSYKKADSKLLNKVILGLSAILIALLIYGNVNGCKCVCGKDKAEETKTGSSVVTTSSSQSSTPSGNTNPGGSTKQEVTVTPAPTQTPTQTPAPTTNPCDPDVIESKWETETLTKEETVTFGYFDAAEEREDELSKADKTYIQEYMDYYGISYEDARVSYMQFGPLSIPTEESYEYSDEVEYETRYVFDADDLAAINLYGPCVEKIKYLKIWII